MIPELEPDERVDALKAATAGVAMMFYRPLVIADGLRWYVAGFWNVPMLAYWHVFGLLALYKSLGGYRKTFAPSTATDGQIAMISLGGLAFSHLTMWLVR